MKCCHHPEIPLLTHPHPIPPLEGEGTFLSLRERIKPVLREVEGVRVGILVAHCFPLIEILSLRCILLLPGRSYTHDCLFRPSQSEGRRPEDEHEPSFRYVHSCLMLLQRRMHLYRMPESLPPRVPIP